jgi:membrane-associated phospholipid phosphatase
MKNPLLFAMLLVACATTVVRASAEESAAPAAAIRSAAAASGSSSGRRPDSLLSRDYATLLWADTRDLLSSPLRWDRDDWQLFGALTAATAGSAVFDQSIRRQTQTHYRSPGNDRFFLEWQKLGAEYSFFALAGFETFGVLGDNPRARAVAMDGVTASVIAGGIITPALKVIIGRVRPTSTKGTFIFKPFSGNQSFPSGHTTQAFAVASVVASHYDAWWQQSLAYGAAGLVGVARIQQNSHFTSDVVAGAAIGCVVGHAVVKRHNETPSPRTAWQTTPWLGSGGGGLLLAKRF